MTEVLTTYVEPERPPRRPWAVGALAVAVVVTLGAGAFAAVSFGASDGSTSPEAAVEKLVAAVEQADVVGILESLTPGERASLQPGLEDLAGELERLGVLEDDFELGPVSGLGADVEGLQLSSTALGDGVSAVTIEAGTITTKTDIAELPVGPLLQVLLADAGSPAGPVAEELAGTDDNVIVAVEEGGGWHVSLWYTLAEAARRDSGKAVPALGQGVMPDGAESPELAVSEALAAALRLDAAGIIALLDPDEARALQDYAPLFLPEVAGAAQGVRADGGYALHVDRLDTTVDRGDGTARVTVEGFAVSGHLPEEGAVSLSFDGTCFRFESQWDGSDEQCLDEMGTDSGFVAGDVPIELTAVERNQLWYLSPTRTVLDGVVASLAELDAGDLADMGASLGGLLGRGLLGMALSEATSTESSSGAPEGLPPEVAAELEKCVPRLEQATTGADPQGEAPWRAADECVSGLLPQESTTVPGGG